MGTFIKLFTFLLFPSFMFSQSYISPIGFEMNDFNKNRVIAFIKSDVKKTYAEIGMDDPSTLRMMEKENLNAFKELLSLRFKNITLLKRVESTYCDIGMCNYNTILMMYKEQLKATSEELEW